MARTTGLNDAAKTILSGQTEFDVEKERQDLGYVPPEKNTRGRPRNNNLVRGTGPQEGLTEDYTRSTFIVNVKLLNKLRDYAYTERVSIKEALERALTQFLEDKNDLIDHRRYR